MSPEKRWPGPRGGGTGPETHTLTNTNYTASEAVQPPVLQIPIRSTVRNIIDLISPIARPAVNEVQAHLIEDALAGAADVEAGDLQVLMGSFERRLLSHSSMINRGGG